MDEEVRSEKTTGDFEEDEYFEDRLDELKQEKAKAKSAFTRARNRLLELVEETDLQRVRDERFKLDSCQTRAMDSMVALSDYYRNQKNRKAKKLVTEEMEKLTKEFEHAHNRAQEYLDERRESASNKSSSSTSSRKTSPEVDSLNQDACFPSTKPRVNSAQHADIREELEEVRPKLLNPTAWEFTPRNIPEQFQYSRPIERQPYEDPLGRDMWRQLQRVSIPVFTGDKRTYPNWKAAFLACIDRAPATPEYKLLQLRQYLSGPALEAVQNLGFSGAAYEVTKERLERKFGGKRRDIAIYLEDLDNFKPVRPGFSKDIEKFADLIDILVVKLVDAGRDEELGNGSLYVKLLRKLPEAMLTQYNRWIYENRRRKCVETLKIWVIQESEFYTEAREIVHGVSNEKKNNGFRNFGGERRTTFFGVTGDRDRINNNQIEKSSIVGEKFYKIRLCKVCNGRHGVWSCEIFRKMDIGQRWNVAKQFKLCFRCLGDDHRGNQCKRTRICDIHGCQDTHNKLLHADKTSEKQLNKEMKDSGSGESIQQLPLSSASTEGEHNKGSLATTTTMMCSKSIDNRDNRATALRIIPVILKNGHKRLKVNALLDDASTQTYVNSDIAAELDLKGDLKAIRVSVLNGDCKSFQSMPVEFGLESINGDVDIEMKALTVNRVTGNMKVIKWADYADRWPHLKHIDFPDTGVRPIVDLLIGIDYLELHYCYKESRGQEGEPFARRTPLGWTCIGYPGGKKIPDVYTNFGITTLFTTRSSEYDDINSTMKRFWDIDSSGILLEEPLVEAESKAAIEKAEKSFKLVDGRYEIGVPWKNENHRMSDNKKMAVNRLKNTEKRLLKNPDVKKAYDDVITQYLQKGYIRKVSVSELQPENRWYLPHFAILKPNRATTKTRIVFDASAKYEGISLNDMIYSGPKLQRSLFDVLLRFRRHPVAIVCDIAEMYLRILIPEADRPYHRFLWRNCEQERDPDEYEFNRVVFGVTSSPFQAQFVIQKHAQLHSLEFPMAAETALKSTYMDDSMDSVPEAEDGIELYNQLTGLWKKAGMQARKWLSNSSKVLAVIPVEDRASEIDLKNGELPTVKTLGILWKAKEDSFCFHSRSPEVEEVITKRSFLKRTATVFDPLGFLAPFIIRAKVIMQDVWRKGVDWDDDLDDELKAKIRSWYGDLELSSLSVPRCLHSGKHENVASMQLHIFTDASEQAYGAVAYVRHTYVDHSATTTNIVAAKTRVAPLVTTSIPRMELMGAVTGLRLAVSVAGALQVSMKQVIFWCDSMNTLWWIRGCSRSFKPFVANRVGEIQNMTNPEQWRYVPTKENPADHLTRGMTVSALAGSDQWWKGPAFLRVTEEEWPVNQFEMSLDAEKEQKKSCQLKLKSATEMHEKKQSLFAVTDSTKRSTTRKSTEKEEYWALEPSRFSSWLRLTRIVAWVYRFLKNCRTTQKRIIEDELTEEEIKDAEVCVIREMQKEVFAEEYQLISKGRPIKGDSKLVALQPRIDEDGVLRCNGRLRYADFLPYDVQHPILLPRKNWVTKLIVKFYHEKNHHPGTNQTYAAISSRFWIISAREEIRQWEHECCWCKKRKAKACNQIMAPLPSNRLAMSLRAFERISVDYGGPFITIQGRGKRREKRYLALFTCLATRAVHLEMAYALDTDSFLNAFYRMVNRRGKPTEVLSDNGTNFISANKELQALVLALDEKQITKSTANQGIKWRFNPPLAPHFGGVHEIMIKAAKRAMAAILTNANVTDEELMTAITGAESLLNSRPLTYQAANVEDDVPLTPNHFLHGQMGGEFAPVSVDHTTFSPTKRWRRVQEIVKHFWQRWLKEWVPGLNRATKWYKERDNLKKGDIVIVISADSPRAHWPLAKVINVFPGKDGRVRIAEIQIGNKLLKRSVTKLCLLESC